jgi:hypothetical protein
MTDIKFASGLGPTVSGNPQSWFDAGYADGMTGKPANPPEAKHSVRAQYQTGYTQGYDAFISANWNK